MKPTEQRFRRFCIRHLRDETETDDPQLTIIGWLIAGHRWGSESELNASSPAATDRNRALRVICVSPSLTTMKTRRNTKIRQKLTEVWRLREGCARLRKGFLPLIREIEDSQAKVHLS